MFIQRNLIILILLVQFTHTHMNTTHVFIVNLPQTPQNKNHCIDKFQAYGVCVWGEGVGLLQVWSKASSQMINTTHVPN